MCEIVRRYLEDLRVDMPDIVDAEGGAHEDLRDACDAPNGDAIQLAPAPAMALLSQRAFTERFVAHFRERLPAIPLMIDDTLRVRATHRSGESGINLHNAYSLYCAHPDDLDDVIAYFATNWMSIIVPAPDDIEETLAALIPCVRTQKWADEMSAWAPDAIPTQPLAADLVVVYAEDKEHTISYKKGASLAEIFAAAPNYADKARENFEEMVDAIDLFSAGEISRATFDQSYDTSLILLPFMWKTLEGIIGPNLAFSLPRRDVFLIANASDARAVTRLEHLTDYCYDELPYRVSPHLYAYRGGEITFLSN